jgi:erythromycin esterase-like protein
MWRNLNVQTFVGWLRQYNESRPEHTAQVGFYGLDLYSLNRSRAEVIRYLERVDPEAARRARYRYSCFDHFGEDEREYGYTAGFNLSPSCEDEVVQQLTDVQRHAYEYLHRCGQVAEDDFFSAEQNARLVRNAEEYTAGCSRAALTPGTCVIGIWRRRFMRLNQRAHGVPQASKARPRPRLEVAFIPWPRRRAAGSPPGRECCVSQDGRPLERSRRNRRR